jgi:AraC-like DNA-binding protein
MTSSQNRPRNRIKLGDISVNFLNAMQKAAEPLERDLSPLFRRYHVTPELLETAGARISIPKFMRIGHEAIAQTGEKALGLLMGQQMHIGDAGLAGSAAITAKDLREALHTFIEFERLSSLNCRGHSLCFMEPCEDDSLLVCQFYSISPYNAYNFFVVDGILSAWFSFAGWISQHKVALERVEIEYPIQSYSDQLENYFQCPVHFSAGRNALIFKSSSASLPSQFRCQSTFQLLTQICKQELDKILGSQNTWRKTEELVMTSLQGEPPQIEKIANKMGMASWTLRRKLNEENTSFSEIVDKVRRELGESYVSDTLLNFTEISFLLGFSSPSAFQRAFKRWTKVSPGEYRNFFKPN